MLDLQRYAFYDAKRTMRLTLEPVSILEMLQDLPGELLFSALLPDWVFPVHRLTLCMRVLRNLRNSMKKRPFVCGSIPNRRPTAEAFTYPLPTHCRR